MRISYSSIETYLQCPQKYKFQEIDRIKAPKGREAIFGTLIHKTLKFMFSRDPLFPTLDEVVNDFHKNWPERALFEAESVYDPLKRSWSEEDEKIYFEEGVRMLKRFYEKNAPWNYAVVDLESKFEITITDEKTGETHVLAGIIDRIDKTPDGKYEIIDYKTGKRMPSQDGLDQNLQLSLYSLGLQKRWPHITANDIKLSLYFLKHGEKLSTTRNTAAAEQTKEHILKTVSEIQGKIRSGERFEPMPSALCNWCSYRPLCPAWKHLYRDKKQEAGSKEDIDNAIVEYFTLKKQNQQTEIRLAELQQEIKDYMASEGLTRVFGNAGVISQKTIQRYAYDWGKIKTLLSPIGKWEEVLKMDEVKLRRVLREIPEEIRGEIENTRAVAKEYAVLTTTFKKSGAEK